MATTYSGDPATSEKDAVRFLLQDTDMGEPLVTDEEIAYAISRWFPIYGTLEYVASTVADVIASRYAREASYSADGVSISLGPVAQQYRDLAASLRQQHKNLFVGGLPDVGGISPDEQLTPGVANFSFGTQMHDYDEAGPQDFGAKTAAPYRAHEEPGL